MLTFHLPSGLAGVMNIHAPNQPQKGTRTKMSETAGTTTENTAVVAAPGANVAPGRASLKQGASQKKVAPTGRQAAKGGKAKAAAPKKEAHAHKKVSKPARAKKATPPHAESKGAKILKMIARAKGATLGEIMKATNWQAHSVRGYISTAAKKHGVKIESSKNESGERLYRITE
jgi:hypothetical protein